jgi:glucose-1-phosphatase
MSEHGIELIIFDLGRVLIDFDFQSVLRNLKKHSPLTERQIRRFFETTPLWDKFEKGQVAPELFFDQMKKDLKLRGLNFQKFALIWNDIFSENHDTVEVLRRLRGRYKIAMLSNVNIMHWEHVQGRHDFMRWIDYPIASYAVGYRKPDPEVFRVVLRRANIPPQKAVFIDDIESHVHAARSIGIRAYQFVNARQLMSDLADVL